MRPPLVCLGMLAVVPAAAATPAPRPAKVAAVRAAAPPTVDGDLSDAAWQAAPWVEGFTLLDRPAVPADPPTRFKVAFDDSHLYFAVECREPEMAGLRADCRDRDGRVTADDCVEMMVDPTGERVEYYHFAVNTLGTLYDAEMRQGGNVRSVAWDCGWRAQARRGQDSWSVEAAIPFVALGLSAKSGGAWAVNVTRERKVGRGQNSTYSPMTGGFHQPGLYAALELPGANLKRYFWEMSRPFEGVVRRDAAGLFYTARLHLTNQTGRLYPVELVPRLIHGEQSAAGEAVKDMLDAGQSREYAFRVPFAAGGPQILSLAVRDRRQPEQVYCLRSIPVTLEYTPVALSVRRPAYRNSIYATEKLDAIEATVKLSLAPEELAGARAVASLTRAGEARPLAEATIEKASAEFPVRLPAAGLAEGEYVLRVAVTTPKARDPYTVSATIRKLPPAPNGHEWRVDENGVLRHNGEAYLPFGWFSMPAAALAQPDCPYTAMQAYNTQYLDVERARASLDEVAAAKSYVTLYPYPSNAVMSRWGQPLSDDEAAALTQRIRALKDHPGVLGWYMADEPELRPALVERLRRARDVIAAEDPYHPCIMLNDTIAGIHKYAEGGDVLMPDPYPCFIQGGAAAQPIEKVSEFIKACREAAGGRKAIWITPQAFNYADYGRKGQRGPNLTELRNMAYQAVVYGATGFLWYTYKHAGNYPDIGLGVPFLGREVQALKAFILLPDVPGAVTVKAPRPEHLHVSLRRVGRDSVLFAVNTATEAQRVEITVPPDLARELFVVSEGRRVSAAPGRFTEEFAPYATHVYATAPEPAGRERLADVQRAVDEQNAARRKPGNLAFEDSGVAVSTSSNSTYGSTPDRVVDGILTNMQWEDGTPRQLPDWIALTWPAARRVGRVVVYTPTLADFEVQVPGEGEEWRTVATVKAAQEERAEATFAPVEAKALRVLVTGLRAGNETSRVWELEAYER